jgi:hypothetical protein
MRRSASARAGTRLIRDGLKFADGASRRNPMREQTMTSFRAPKLLLAVLGTFLLVSSAAADEVVLWSGEHLTGRIVDKSPDAVTLRTASSDELRIKWGDIFALRTDAPMDGMLAHDSGARRPAPAPAARDMREDPSTDSSSRRPAAV